MYRWIRNTHLLLGLGSVAYIMMYALGAMEMAHHGWFGLTPTVTEDSKSLEPGSDNPRAVARELMDRYNLRGELRQIVQTPEGFRFRLVWIGANHQVNYEKAAGQTRIKTSTTGLFGVLSNMHEHSGGVGHDDWLANLLGFMVGATSCFLLILGATGLYLWFKLHKERATGMILLSVNLAIAVALIGYIRH
jgi:hypothetical protein